MLGMTRFMDIGSQQYVNCAQKWQKSTMLAQNQPNLAARLLKIEEKNEMTFDGKACPALRYDHAEKIRAQLKAASNS